jgi:putative mRNA 3-end processing factor
MGIITVYINEFMKADELLRPTARGLWCEAGDFYIDPSRAVERAFVTHAHSDHAVRGSRQYVTAREGEKVLRTRIGSAAMIATLAFGESMMCNGVRVSLHPAGHILGSAQVRCEYRGEVWVVSGDYKLDPDPTCTPFEPVRCHTFITEATFARPVFRWPAPAEVFSDINDWWRSNQAAGKASLLFGYAVGKAQRLLASIDRSIGPVYTHRAVDAVAATYRETGVALPATTSVRAAGRGTDWSRALIVAPPLASGTPWLRRFGAVSTGLASGWMCLRGGPGRRGVDRGFVISDHADWPGLWRAITATGAGRVLVVHGYVETLVRGLRKSHIDAEPLAPDSRGPEEAAEQEE